MGFLLVSYGLLRQSFTDLAEKRGFGEGRYGEGPYGGGLTAVQRWLVSFGKSVRLLSNDESLTLTDRKKNAALAIAGVISVVSSFGLDLVSRIWLSCAG
ncbi:MAG TPA: hypothetical protein VFS23_33755 [Vicinamibacterales bacterium]|jgi:hypothetical protein|nr:hypothetical protein [Vicinamibacterales bacterium]